MVEMKCGLLGSESEMVRCGCYCGGGDFVSARIAGWDGPGCGCSCESWMEWGMDFAYVPVP